jgi:hypothetical protein
LHEIRGDPTRRSALFAGETFDFLSSYITDREWISQIVIALDRIEQFIDRIGRNFDPWI